MHRPTSSLYTILLATFFLLFGCLANEGELDTDNEGIDEETSSQSYAISVDVDPETMEPTIILPDGTITNSFEEYATAVSAIYNNDPEANIEFAFGDNLGAIMDFEIGPETEERWGPYNILSYVLTGGMHYNAYVSCFSRIVNHYDTRIHRNNNMLVGMHIGLWWQNGRVCYGVYNSGSYAPFCRTGCSPTYTQVVYAIRDALVVIGLTAGTAYVIAQIVAPVAIGAMGFAL